jgi:hypothetical protein
MGTGLNQDLFPGWPKDATSIQSGTATIITPTNPGYYPDVPIACLLGEFVEFVPADPNRTDDARNYGKINVNTATADVLRALPWPAMPLVGNPTKLGTNPTNDISAYAAEFILAYRDRRVVQISPSNAIVPDYSNRAAATHIANLRAYSDFNGFVTPGEVAIPLADLMLAYLANGNNALTLSNPVLYTDATARTVVLDPTKPATVNNLKKLYPFVRDYLYRSVSNLLTVRSDTFTVYIDVELRDIYGQKTLQSPWHYMALIDRSNCRKAGDKPAVLMFTEIK